MPLPCVDNSSTTGELIKNAWQIFQRFSKKHSLNQYQRETSGLSMKDRGFKTTVQGLSVARHQQLSASKTVKTGSSSKTYGTMATELPLEEDQIVTPILAKPAPSEKRLGENIFPDPPKEPRGKAFECNQCFYILSHETRQVALWMFVYHLFL